MSDLAITSCVNCDLVLIDASCRNTPVTDGDLVTGGQRSQLSNLCWLTEFFCVISDGIFSFFVLVVVTDETMFIVVVYG